MEKYISNYTGEQIDALLSQIQSNVSQADLDALKAELVLRLQGTSTNQDGYKDPIFYKEFVGSATLDDMNTWLNNQFFAIKDGVYYRNGQSGSYAISKDVPQCLINLSYQGVKIYVYNAPRSFATGTFEQFAIGAAVGAYGITWGSHIMRRESTYDFTTKKATWTAWEKINSDVDKSYVDTQLATKVDKVAGKGLSTNDYTTAEKTKLAGVETGANKTIVDTQLSTSSTNPVQNKAVAASLNAKVNIIFGKGLSTNDYTTEEKNLVATIPDKADKTYVDTQLSTKVDKVSGKGLSTNDFTFAYKSAAETLRTILNEKDQTQNGVIDIVSNLCLGILYESEERLQIGAHIPLANHYTFKHEIANRSGSYIELDCQTFFVNYYDSWSSIDRLRLYIRVPKNESYSEVLICGIEYDGKNYYWKVLDKFTDGGFEESDTDMIRHLFFPVSYTREQVKAINTTLSQKTDKTYVDAQLDTKVSKVAGKGLSTNDFSNAYKAKVDNYSAGVIYNYIDGLTYIYKSDDNIASAGVGDNISIYDDERGNISNFFSIEAGGIIVCDNNPILEYVSPSQLCVLAVPDATGKCTYTNNTGSTREICVLVNSNARMEVSLSSIQTAIRDANEVAQKVENLANEALSQVALLIPESLSVEAPKRLTWGNKVTNYIKAVLAPINVVQNIIYIGDNKAVEVGTDGSINVIAKGISRVHVIPTNKTALAKTIQIEVGDPRLRISAKTQLRFTANGSLRLT